MNVMMMYFMIEQGISFDALSAKTGIKEQYLRDIACGKVDALKVKTIRTICSSLNCSVEALFNL